MPCCDAHLVFSAVVEASSRSFKMRKPRDGPVGDTSATDDSEVLVRHGLARVHNIADVRERARRRLPRPLFDFVDGAAENEWTASANRRDFDDLVIRPRMATGAPPPVLDTTVLGVPISMPLMLAPCGMIRAVHPDAEPGVARAADEAGTLSILSLSAGTPMESVAESMAPGRRWCQAYFFDGRRGTEAMLNRAKAAGFDTLVITVDMPVAGNRERDVRNRIDRPLGVNVRSAIDMAPHIARRPEWFLGFMRDGMPLSMVNLPTFRPGLTALTAANVVRLTPPTWSDVTWARELWDGPVVVKGIVSGDDARNAVDSGADAIVVSNHGGRQLDGLPSTITALPEVAEAVGSQVELLLDGGVRRGAHVLKAVSLGARAVLVGRPYVYGLAMAGTAGVSKVLDIFRDEMARALMLSGYSTVSELGPDWVQNRRTSPLGVGGSDGQASDSLALSARTRLTSR